MEVSPAKFSTRILRIPRQHATKPFADKLQPAVVNTIDDTRIP
jgi:hypothetical protein